MTSKENPLLVIDEMVRHVCLLERTRLATLVDAHLASGNHEVTAHLLFTNILGWIRARGRSGRITDMNLPHYTWSEKLKEIVPTHPELSKIFQIRDDKLSFTPNLTAEELHKIVEHVVSTYNPKPRK